MNGIIYFPEDDPKWFTIKVLFICGLCFGFRGSSEHTDLKVDYLKTGWYPQGHSYFGYRWVGFGQMPSKTNKLSFTSDYLTKDSHCRIPIFDMQSKRDRGASLLSYTFKMHTSQVRFHTQAITSDQSKHFADGGFPGVSYAPKLLLEKNTIASYFKQGAEKLGLSEPEKFGPHSLRAVFIQRLVNDPNVSQKESMIASRHHSVSAQLTYTASNNSTEVGKLAALGFSLPPNPASSPKTYKSLEEVEKDVEIGIAISLSQM